MTARTKASEMWQQILSAPGDQNLRESFVQALQETGDPRAEIFRLADLLEKNPRWRNEDIYMALLEQYQSSLVSWRAGFDSMASGWQSEIVFVRGLPIEVTVAASDFVHHAGEIVSMIPLRHLNLSAIAASTEVFQAPQLAQIASIDGSKQPWSGEPIKALAASVWLTDLRWLDLSGSDIVDADIEILAASPNLRQLEYIDFRRNPCRDPVDASAGYGSDEYGRIVWESVYLPEHGQELERRHGRIEWLRSLENFMEKHPPKRYLF